LIFGLSGKNGKLKRNETSDWLNRDYPRQAAALHPALHDFLPEIFARLFLRNKMRFFSERDRAFDCCSIDQELSISQSC
jgi:hypothetical protein